MTHEVNKLDLLSCLKEVPIEVFRLVSPTSHSWQTSHNLKSVPIWAWRVSISSFNFCHPKDISLVKAGIVISARLGAGCASLFLFLGRPLKHHPQCVLVVLRIFWECGIVFKNISWTCQSFLKVLQLDFPLGIGLFFSHPPHAYCNQNQILIWS